MGMVAYWIVIMCSITCAISKSQVWSQGSNKYGVNDVEDSCTTKPWEMDQFLEYAPCPPITKTHLLCDFPVTLTCQERTRILRKCVHELKYIYKLDTNAISRVFETCNQSSIMVQCDEFFSLCKNVSNFKCGSPKPTKSPPTTIRPPVIQISTTKGTTTTLASNVSDSNIDDSDLEVDGGRPEHPVINAGADDRNWLPLLFLLLLPIVAVILCIAYCIRRRRKSLNGNHGKESPQEELLIESSRKSEVALVEILNKRVSCIGEDVEDERFKRIPYIDQDVDNTNDDNSNDDVFNEENTTE